MDWRVSPCWHFSLPTLLSFSSTFVGMGDGSFPPTFTPAQIFPCPPLSHRRQRKGGGVGGQGSPSVLRLHRVFRLNQEIFYYQKEKRKKKIPAAACPPCPIGTAETGSVGSPGGGSGLERSQARVVGSRQALRQARFGPLPSPPLLPLRANHQRWPSPDLRPLGWSLGGWGLGQGVLRSPEVVGLAARHGALASLHTVSSAPFPRAGHFLPQAAVGTFVPPQKSVPSSPSPSR